MEHFEIRFRGASCRIQTRPDKAYLLTCLETMPEFRRQGDATRVMRMACDYADSQSKSLYLWIGPTGPMDHSALDRFYSRFGFQPYCTELPTWRVRHAENRP